MYGLACIGKSELSVLWYTLKGKMGTDEKATHPKSCAKGGRDMDYQFRYVNGHVEVYDQRGDFLFSADNQQEAFAELNHQNEAA